jgi:hypothetical protein
VDRVSVWLGANLQASLGNGQAPDFFRDRWGKGPIALDNQSSLTADLGGIVAIARGWGVVVDGWRVLWAERYPALTGASVGVSWDFSLPERHTQEGSTEAP